MQITRISRIRRLVQVLSLLLIIYGGFLFKHITEAPEVSKGLLFPAIKAPAGAISTTQLPQGSILWPSGATPVLENYPPSLICRFNPKGGMFKACIVHFISENLSWQTKLKYWIPHLALFVFLCFLLNRSWCGWMCPIGTVGDLLTWLRRKMNVAAHRFSVVIQRSLRTTGYGIMFLSYGISAFIGMPNFSRFQCFWFLPYCQICPARLICPMFGLIRPSWYDFSNVITTSFTFLAWLFLGIFVAAFYLGRRVWCHLCPVGIMNSWFNKGGAIELHKRASKCNKCASCADACPMGLTKMYEADKDTSYNQKECIMCLRCVEVCPREKCLSARYFGKLFAESGFKRPLSRK